MKPNIFMSYSRREVGFVDDLTNKLEKAGYQVWLDYRSLVPGTSWAGQIERGLEGSDVILLVVSKSSMASKYVEFEWQRVLEQKKRVILVIFEAVDLPKELEKFEWVDFRGSYSAGVRELLSQLELPIKEKHPAPETGFKVPAVVWWSAAFGVLAGIFSLYAWWTILIPLLLVPLPYRIFKRNFNYSQVQAALWLMPVGIYITGLNGGLDENTFFFLAFCPLVSGPLIALLGSAGMQRWGKPEATRVKFANPYRPNNPNPKPVAFFIDHAAQDDRIARELTKTLVKYGHPQAADINTAQAVFVLISVYKTDSNADPEKQTVFPILVQTAQPAPKLSKVQWIDFRKGIGNLDAIAQLMPEPAKLLAALGVRPMGNQLALPPIINATVYYLITTIVLLVGSLVIDVGQILTQENVELPILGIFLCTCLLGALAYWMVRTLTRRGGWLATAGRFVLAYFVMNGLFLWLFFGLGIVDKSTVDMSMFAIFTFILFMLGGFVLGLIALFRFRTIRLWFPAKGKKNA